MSPPPNHSHLTPLPLQHRPLRHRCSKAQTSFFNILHIISIHPSNDVTGNHNHHHRELAADVNIRLRPPSPASAVSDNCVFEKKVNNNNNRVSELNDICDNREVVADVNVRLRPPSPASAVSENCVFEKKINNNNRLSELNDEICDNREVVADVNVCLRPPATAVSENHVFEKNNRFEIESELAVEEDSEISHVGDQSSSVNNNNNNNNNNNVKPRDEEGYLGLLIEAAQLILAEDSVSDHDLKPKPKPLRRSKSKYVDVPAAARGGAKRKTQCWTAAVEAEWYAEFEEASPVVKSKRGRNQVLPYKYRDSVVERWSSEMLNDVVVPSRRRSK